MNDSCGTRVWSLFRKFCKYKLWDLVMCYMWVEKEQPKVMSRFPGSMTEWKEEEKAQVAGKGRCRSKTRNIFCVLYAYSIALMTALTIIVIIIFLS